MNRRGYQKQSKCKNGGSEGWFCQRYIALSGKINIFRTTIFYKQEVRAQESAVFYVK